MCTAIRLDLYFKEIQYFLTKILSLYTVQFQFILQCMNFVSIQLQFEQLYISNEVKKFLVVC